MATAPGPVAHGAISPTRGWRLAVGLGSKRALVVASYPMTTVIASALPEGALLQAYASPAGYADCYVTEVAGTVSHEAFVRAFYTTPLIRVERTILSWFASRPSVDEDVDRLATGSSDEFAAWRVENRSEDQVLLADYTGRTRSWLMVKPVQGAERPRTQLYFGSAVVPRIKASTGEMSMGLAFAALLGFHRLYSRSLLRAACARIRK